MKSAAWWAPTHLWSSESNKTPVIWQGSKIRCNTSRDLQSRRSSSCRETESLQRVISHYVEKRSHPSRIQGCNNYPPIQKERESSACNNHRGISLLSVAGKILARVLLNRLNGQGFYQKASVDSGKTEEQWTWPLQHDSFKKNARNRMWLLHDLCRPHQSIWHNQSWGTLENYGKVWLSCQIHSNGAAIPWWYACKGPKWWRVFWSISCYKWS